MKRMRTVKTGVDSAELKVETLSKCLEFWDVLTEEEKAQVVERTKVSFLSAGRYMDYDFEKNAGMRLIGKGAIRIIGNFSNGEELTLSIVRGGETCSLSMTEGLDKMDFSVSLEIEEDTYVYLIPKEVYDKLLENPEVYKTELERSHRTLLRIIEVISFNMMNSVEDRVLWSLKNRVGSDGKTVKVTHEQLAREIGSAREVVSRALKALEQRGLVRMGRGAITVNERA